jgi:hypothetical protein
MAKAGHTCDGPAPMGERHLHSAHLLANYALASPYSGPDDRARVAQLSALLINGQRWSVSYAPKRS